MSSHTTYFCDHCNYDHDYDGAGGACAVNYDEMPTYAGWAAFEELAPGSARPSYAPDIHVCAHCLADPDFEPDHRWTPARYDDQSKQNIATGRAHAAAYTWAREHLGRTDRFGRTGVDQVFDPYRAYGPKLEDGRFATTDRIYVPKPGAFAVAI